MMLTRKSTKIDWTDMDDDDWARIINMTEEEEVKRDAEFERESATFEREHRQFLARLTTLQRYRYERHFLLISILRCRVRRDNYLKEPMFDFLVAREAAILKKRQMALLDWRRFLVTGIAPAERDQ